MAQAHSLFDTKDTRKFDRLFYPCALIGPRERRVLGRELLDEGAVIIVPSQVDDLAQFHIYKHVADFIRGQRRASPAPQIRGRVFRLGLDRRRPVWFAAAPPRRGRVGPPLIDAVVVAGVGSSAWGGVAFARQAALALNRPVACVVAGQGAQDWVSEGLSGYYYFHARDLLRWGLRAAAPSFLGPVLEAAQDWAKGVAPMMALRDADALTAMLRALGPQLRWLIGHSKGCFMIDHALEAWDRRDERAGAALQAVHFGVALDGTRRAGPIHRFIGAEDALGKANSTPGAPCRVLPGVGHHTAGRVQGLKPLPVTEILAALAAGQAPLSSRRQALRRMPRQSLTAKDIHQGNAATLRALLTPTSRRGF